VSDYDKSLHRHDKKQKMESRKAAYEEVRLQTTAKTGSEGADVMCGGRPFQIHAAATGKA